MRSGNLILDIDALAKEVYAGVKYEVDAKAGQIKTAALVFPPNGSAASLFPGLKLVLPDRMYSKLRLEGDKIFAQFLPGESSSDFFKVLLIIGKYSNRYGQELAQITGPTASRAPGNPIDATFQKYIEMYRNVVKDLAARIIDPAVLEREIAARVEGWVTHFRKDIAAILEVKSPPPPAPGPAAAGRPPAPAPLPAATAAVPFVAASRAAPPPPSSPPVVSLDAILTQSAKLAFEDAEAKYVKHPDGLTTVVVTVGAPRNADVASSFFHPTRVLPPLGTRSFGIKLDGREPPQVEFGRLIAEVKQNMDARLAAQAARAAAMPAPPPAAPAAAAVAVPPSAPPAALPTDTEQKLTAIAKKVYPDATVSIYIDSKDDHREITLTFANAHNANLALADFPLGVSYVPGSSQIMLKLLPGKSSQAEFPKIMADVAATKAEWARVAKAGVAAAPALAAAASPPQVQFAPGTGVGLPAGAEGKAPERGFGAPPPLPQYGRPSAAPTVDLQQFDSVLDSKERNDNSAALTTGFRMLTNIQTLEATLKTTGSTIPDKLLCRIDFNPKVDANRLLADIKMRDPGVALALSVSPRNPNALYILLPKTVSSSAYLTKLANVARPRSFAEAATGAVQGAVDAARRDQERGAPLPPPSAGPRRR